MKETEEQAFIRRVKRRAELMRMNPLVSDGKKIAEELRRLNKEANGK